MIYFRRDHAGFQIDAGGRANPRHRTKPLIAVGDSKQLSFSNNFACINSGMSSNEEDYQDGEGSHGAKKRRIQRACDICRRKKSMFPF